MQNREKVQILVNALQALGNIPIEMKHSPTTSGIFTSIMEVVTALNEEAKAELEKEAEANIEMVKQAMAKKKINGEDKTKTKTEIDA